MLFETSALISAARDKGSNILQLFSRLNSDTKECSAVCKMCKMASTNEAILKAENAHKIHNLAWLGHLKLSHMCVVVTGWPYSSARLITPLKQASPSRRENSSFVDKGLMRS